MESITYAMDSIAKKRPPRRKEARYAPPASEPSADHPFAKLGALRGRG